MSAADNKKLMQEIFAAVARGERTAYVDRLADDVIMTVTGQYSWSRTFRGKDSVMRDLYGYVASRVNEGRRTIPIRVLADEDWVVVEAVGDMTTGEGTRYDNQYCLLYRLRDGKIVEIREYNDSLLCERVLGPYPVNRLAS
jgi:ketosteroid isomerase-like protein